MTESYTGLGDMSAKIIEGFTTTSADVLLLFAQLIPIGLGIFAVSWGVRKGIGFFKKTTA